VVSSWNEVPMPMNAPTIHNPALLLDWCRFCSDTIVQFVRMQADLLHELTPGLSRHHQCARCCIVSTISTSRSHRFRFDRSTAALKTRSAELACGDRHAALAQETGIRTPDGDAGFGHGTEAGNVSWQDVNSLVRPGVLRMFTYRWFRAAPPAILFFRWRQPRFGSEKFHGAVLQHNARNDGRVFKSLAVGR
jgi:beta-galactosidase